MTEKYKVFIVSHSHWDREWYQTFQGFRKRLVFMLDELIEHLERDQDYVCFHMDGQTIVLEDYLEIRPENEFKLKQLIKNGRIIIGPWYVMPDEFLVSGESLVRNLQKGFKICESYGTEALKCGYVVDIFGHNSQMPQILQGFGLKSAILFRGIGDYPKDAFIWSSVDGSSVLCVKLDPERAYSNFFFAIRWPFEGREYNRTEIADRMKNYIDYASKHAVSNNILMMDGVDHAEIEPQLTNIISNLNEDIENIEFIHSTLEDYISEQKLFSQNLDIIKGKLYSPGKKGLNNRVLKNVLSSMVHLKQMNNMCEILLLRWAEPFHAITGYIKDLDLKGFLNEAWKLLIQNHPHDSICGCSITRVHKDNEYRFDQVKDLAMEIINMEFAAITSSINTITILGEQIFTLFNGSQAKVSEVVEIELEFPQGSEGLFKIYDANGTEIPYQILNVQKSVTKQVISFRKLIDFKKIDIYTICIDTTIPQMGYNTYGYKEFRNIQPSHGDYTFPVYYQPVRYLGSMRVDNKKWENEFLILHITDSGMLCVTNKKTGKIYNQLLSYEDSGDTGDGWNYQKPLKDSTYYSDGSSFDFCIEHDGFLLLKIRLRHYMKTAKKINEDGIQRSHECGTLEIDTYITMKKGSAKIEFKTIINNNIKDHRLRVRFPTYMDCESYYASTPFWFEKVDICKTDWNEYMEVETGVHPNQGIVMMKDHTDCIALYNKGLYEIEVTEDKSHTLELTLFRSFGNEVGRDKAEMGYMLRCMEFEYALEFFDSSTCETDVLISGEQWKTGVKYAYTDRHEGVLGLAESFLKVEIPGVLLTAYKQWDKGRNVIRMVNCAMNDTQGYLELYRIPQKVYRLDLHENIIDEMDFDGNRIHLDIPSGKIVTLGYV